MIIPMNRLHDGMNGWDWFVNDSASDIVRGHWMDRLVPRPLRPYARLARLRREPVGILRISLQSWLMESEAETVADGIAENSFRFA